MFSEHVEEFDGRPVVSVEEGTTLDDPAGTAYRIALDYDDPESLDDKLARLLGSPACDRIEALVIGVWGNWEELYETTSAAVVESLVAAAPQLASLKALFIGDIISEENEVSWIQQTDISPLWTAFPLLETLQIRGSQGLSLGNVEHDQLRKLVIQCGGLPKNVLQELTNAHLPALEHLELYLGQENYGFDGSVDDIDPLLNKANFPKLKYLGLRNAESADYVARVVVDSPLLQQVEVLDLSLGALGDEGAEHLLNSPAVAKLKKLDLHYNFLSEEMAKRLQELPCQVNTDDRQVEEDWGRYSAIGE